MRLIEWLFVPNCLWVISQPTDVTLLLSPSLWKFYSTISITSRQYLHSGIPHQHLDPPILELCSSNVVQLSPFLDHDIGTNSLLGAIIIQYWHFTLNLHNFNHPTLPHFYLTDSSFLLLFLLMLYTAKQRRPSYRTRHDRGGLARLW